MLGTSEICRSGRAFTGRLFDALDWTRPVLDALVGMHWLWFGADVRTGWFGRHNGTDALTRIRLASTSFFQTAFWPHHYACPIDLVYIAYSENPSDQIMGQNVCHKEVQNWYILMFTQEWVYCSYSKAFIYPSLSITHFQGSIALAMFYG